MPGNALILHMEPGEDAAGNISRLLLPHLCEISHRTVSDERSLLAALEEKQWCAVLQGQDVGDSQCPVQIIESDFSFLDSLPGMACRITLDKQGKLSLPYVSEGSVDLLGIRPADLSRQPERLLALLHPEDEKSFHRSMLSSVRHASAWNWEGRIVMSGEIKWINLRAAYHNSDAGGTHWKAFVVNITQNKEAEIELVESRQRLSELSSHIELIKEEERARIAREIHDEIGVLLTALKMDLSWLAHRLDKDALLEKTQDMANLLDAAGRAANNLVHSLRPGSLDCFGIVATIEIEAKEFTKRTGIPCKVIKSQDRLDLTDEQSITLFRVFQETLNNIMKHASARHVQIEMLNPDRNHVELIVNDDGIGFDEKARNKPRSFGLRGIQERIRQLGGRVDIASRPGKGTRIAVSVPMNFPGKAQT